MNKTLSVAMLSLLAVATNAQTRKAPNVIFVLADEWRAQATGFNGDPNVKTPNLDKLEKSSVNFLNTVSNCPVSGPYRASLLTGQYPLTHGCFINDVELNPEAVTMGKIFKEAGYETAYVGKWHLDGYGRSAFIPKERRQGFDYWKVLECTHNYNNSFYWGNDEKKAKWDGYDAYAQTTDVVEYIKDKCKGDKPFLMFLSWGPPHTPFEMAPENYKKIYREMELTLRDNVPAENRKKAIKDLIGYYGHITALDSCIGVLQKTVKEAGIDENTIFVFTSDHGHMVQSHGFSHKQRPYEESIMVPMLIRYPKLLGDKGRKTDMLINTPDILPTLLGLSNINIPGSIEGNNKADIITKKVKDKTKAALIACYHPFGNWPAKAGGKEYRGVRTKRYTYVKDMKGSWLLFDNKKDPYQLTNLVDSSKYDKLKAKLEIELNILLKETKDKFWPGMDYVNKWGYKVDETGTAPYIKVNFKGIPIKN
jgi:arylsulfatase A-like enzyme